LLTRDMATLLLKTANHADVHEAGRLLREGAIVAFPTETVYGLGARADDPQAVQALYELKQRPPEKKMTVLIADPEDAARYAVPLSPVAAALARAFWPGPLTLVVPDGKGGEVGLRCPDCEPTRAMLRAAGVPVVAPSANLSGRPPATSAEEVLAVLDGKIAAVLDGGPVRIGAPSSVVRAVGDVLEVLREGALTEEQIRAAGKGNSGLETGNGKC
jgi:L-threonylcarbamoyladenylate synthase